MLAPPPTDELAPPRIAAPPIVASRTDPREEPELCLASPAAQRTLAPSQSLAPAAFGSALAQAARTQTADLVIYNDTYRHIAYPMGDVPALYGVCTDVIIRAYRALGIDLQQRVHESGLGSGDTSIDHRRTEALRRFFARYGEQIAASSFAEDYRPGDVVTYNRPQNRHSRSHIALVSDVIAPSGRYMIVHNRGWGPQLEDALFVDEITGHYRYYGAEQPPKVPVSLAAAGEAAKLCAGAMRGRMRSACLRQAQANSARTHADGTLVRGLGR